ncbi:MAG: protein kinase [Gemmatimonadota bacterium]
MTDPIRDHLQRHLGAAYDLRQELQGAGMSRVFVAEERRFRRQVVIKAFSPELSATLSVSRFKREIRLAASLQQANIVPVLDAGDADGLPWYSMPFVDGQSLRARLDSGTLAMAEATRVLHDIARALAYAHAQGVVHRDIKPENVLLSGGTAVVTDFGIAKALSIATRPGSNSLLTMAGMALGSPQYMAPEQIAADPGVDQRADLYAWGVLAYELLTGRHPFAGHTGTSAMLAAHIVSRPEVVTTLRPDLAAPLAAIVMRCLEKEPDARPSDGAGLLPAFDRTTDTVTPATRRRLVSRAVIMPDAVTRQIPGAAARTRLQHDGLQCLENDAPSDVLLFCLHGLGADATQFAPFAEAAPHRVLVPTLFGFEAAAPGERIALDLKSHLLLLAEVLREAVARHRPARVIVIGFALGADLALQLIASVPGLPEIHGCLALSPNLSLATCYASRMLARLEQVDSEALLVELRRMGDDAADLDAWLNVMLPLLLTLQKFRHDLRPLRQLAGDAVRPFVEGDPFPGWFRDVATRVPVVRCVFEDNVTSSSLLQLLRMRHVDERLLGPRYRIDSLILEPTTDHAALLEFSRVAPHVEAMLAVKG